MSMHEHIATPTQSDRSQRPGSGGRYGRSGRRWSSLIRLVVACLLGVATAVLVSCGSSGKGLIPLANAGPLQSDFEAVVQAAQTGDGNCTATISAINKTEQDFAALPSTTDPGLRQTLSKGISNLRERALALCAQPLARTTTTSAPHTTTTTTTKTETQPPAPTTQTTSTQTSPTTPTTPPNNGGGTVAPGSEGPPGVGPGGGTGAGESGGAGNQEGVK